VGQTPGPLNNDLILARYALDTTPAGAEVNKTSVEVQSSIRLQVYPDFKFKHFAHTLRKSSFSVLFLANERQRKKVASKVEVKFYETSVPNR